MRRLFAALAMLFALAAPDPRLWLGGAAPGALSAAQASEPPEPRGLAQAGTTAADVVRAKRCAPPFGCRHVTPAPARPKLQGGYSLASYYARAHHGRRTANGERFDMNAPTCAHKWLPFGTRLQVCRNGRCTICRVNDRGPYVPGRSLDLSRAGARAIGLVPVGVGAVHIDVVPPSDSEGPARQTKRIN